MITPTGSTPMAYYEAHKNQFTHAKITFTDNNVVFEDDEFESNGITVSQYMNSDTDLTFGTASCVELEINMFRSNKTDVLKWSDEFLLQFGYDDGEGGIDWFNIGYFTGSKPERTKTDVITFRAYDRMIRFDIQADDFIDSLDFTSAKTLTQIYSALCTYIGVSSVSGDEIAANMAHSFSSFPIGHGCSCRDILGYIAEAAGCYAIITPAGNVKMVWYSDHTDDFVLKRDDIFSVDISEVDWSYDASLRKKWVDLETEKWKDLENLQWKELEGYYTPTKINALKFIYSDEDVGITVPNSLSTKNVYTIVDNPFLYGSTTVETTGYLTNLYNRLSAFGTYVPVTLECVGNVFVETGDIIKLEFSDDSYGNFPVFNRILRYNGALVCSYEATGNLDRSPVSGDDKKILEANGKIHILRKTVDELYSEIYDPNTGLSTRINQTEEEIQLVAQKTGNKIYHSSTAPTGTQSNPLFVGDYWIDTAHNNKLYRCYSISKNLLKVTVDELKQYNTEGDWDNPWVNYLFNNIGYIFTVTDDGYVSTITLYGYVVDDNASYLNLCYPDVTTDVEYVLNGRYGDGKLQIINDGVVICESTGSDASFTLDSAPNNLYCRIYMGTGDVGSGITYYNPMLRRSSSSAQYETYFDPKWEDSTFVDPGKYDVQSGIEITSDGVDITGNKYVNVESGDNKWTFNALGLKYVDDNTPDGLCFQIANASDRETYASGIFTQYLNNMGQIYIVPICKTTYHTDTSFIYGGMIVEYIDEPDYYDPVRQTTLRGNHTVVRPMFSLGYLGKYLNNWERVYSTIYVGNGYPLPSNPGNNSFDLGRIRFAPSAVEADIGKEIILALWYNSGTYMYKLYPRDGNKLEIEGYIKNITTTETDLNNITEKGEYWLGFNGLTNKPSAITTGTYLLVVNPRNSNHIQQIIYQDQNIWTRIKYSGTWNQWYKHTGTT